MKASDILYSAWGYEQTNVNFYIVVKATEKTVLLQEIGSNYGRADEFMCGTATPDPLELHGKPFRRKIGRSWRGEPCVSITDYENAYQWDGTPIRYSNYA